MTLPALGYFARHGRSFHFASQLLSAGDRDRVAAVYAYCRQTDDIVDEAGAMSAAMIARRLDAWHALSRSAYDGFPCGDAVVDRAMYDMRAGGVPFSYASELIAGMRMDVVPTDFRDLAALRDYAHRVAGVVGLWMSQLFGVREPWVLHRAALLGHAMQLTNIVRDVGDDLRRGRVYLPVSMMRSYGLSRADLDAMAAGARPISTAYRAVLEALMTTADAHYAMAFEAMPLLPTGFRRSVAVAAEVYRGIHDEVRAADYDTLTRRAVTTSLRKCVLGVRGLRRLRVIPTAAQDLGAAM
jgi:phytoene synthase